MSAVRRRWDSVAPGSEERLQEIREDYKDVTPGFEGTDDVLFLLGVVSITQDQVKALRKAIRDRSVYEDGAADGPATGGCTWCGTHWYGSETHHEPDCPAKAL
jgi:hypothetical protein